MFKYFVSFNHNSKNGSGFGNTEVNTNIEIKSIVDVTNIAEKIAQNKGFTDVVILNFIRLN